MEGIKYNSKPQEQSLSNRLTNKIKAADIPQNIKDGLISYSFGIDEPNGNAVILVIKRSGYYWPYIQQELTQAELNSIQKVPDSWFNNDI